MKEHHPLTELIPTRADQSALSLDIAQSGPHEPVILYEGKIIEGRVRYAACLEVGMQPQFRDFVLFEDGAPLDWMVKHHVESHSLEELDLIRLVAAVLPAYREMPGSTEPRLHQATGLAIRKIRVIAWLLDAKKLDAVLSGEKDLYEAGRAAGIVAEKRSLALGKSYGQGDKFDEATQPLKRYLASWKRKDYEFRHVNPAEARRRLAVIDQLVEELVLARPDLEKRAVSSTLTAPPERKEKIRE